MVVLIAISISAATLAACNRWRVPPRITVAITALPLLAGAVIALAESGYKVAAGLLLVAGAAAVTWILEGESDG